MKLGIIGCGNMGGAFARAFAKKHEVYLFDAQKDKAYELAHEIKGRSCQKIEDLIAATEVVFLAIKPKDLAQFAEEATFSSDQVVVSMLSGLSLEELSEAFGDHLKLVRIMPNIAVRYQLGVIGAAKNDNIVDSGPIESLLKETGLVIWLEERMIDALTPLSGCGPAFVFLILEAFIEAGIALGFPPSQGKELAVQTFEGALHMIKESGKVPCELKWQVTSPAGDTIRGLCEMERQGVKSGLIQGILKAKPHEGH